MSRIAKYPVEVPKGVEVMLSDTEISIKGPLGTLKQCMLPSVKIDRDGRVLKICSGLRPWRMGVALRAFAAMEFADGVASQGISRGDRLVIVSPDEK